MAAADHYSSVTTVYETAWCYQNDGDFQKWLLHKVEEALPSGCKTLADVGCGTANFSAALQKSTGISVSGVEPSQEMADKAADYGISVHVSDAVAWASNEDGVKYDAVMLKEVRHHIDDPDKLYRKLAGRLQPGGRVMLLTRPDHSRDIYPFPAKAHKTWADGVQLSLDAHKKALMDAGFNVSVRTERYPVSMDREEWERLVNARLWSNLRDLTDNDISDGMQELNLPETVCFEDCIVFVVADLVAETQ